MMPGNMIASPALGRRPVHHIGKRPVLFHKIKVCSGEIIHLMAQVSHQGQGLQENFGKEDCGTDIQVCSALQFSDLTAKETKIMVCC